MDWIQELNDDNLFSIIMIVILDNIVNNAYYCKQV